MALQKLGYVSVLWQHESGESWQRPGPGQSVRFIYTGMLARSQVSSEVCVAVAGWFLQGGSCEAGQGFSPQHKPTLGCRTAAWDPLFTNEVVSVTLGL